MSNLLMELDRYIAIRRGLGFDLSTDYRLLRRFVGFAEERGISYVSTQLFLDWQANFGRANRATWSHRFCAVRQYANWLHCLDPVHEVPPAGLIPTRITRSTPYIYSEDEIVRIIKGARELPSPYGLRALTYTTLFALLSVTGLRINEAMALDNGDIDTDAGVITVRNGKLGKMRLVPVTDTTARALDHYAHERDRLLQYTPEYFFAQENGTRSADCSTRYNFAVVCQNIGLRAPQRFTRHGRGPRIHDLRHTFAVRAMLNWYRRGDDPAQEMIKLTTWLGHASAAHTYWYIEAVPELLALATERVEAIVAGDGQ